MTETATFAPVQKMTINDVHTEIQRLTNAWLDNTQECTALVNRIEAGWSKYIDALKAGKPEVARGIWDKIKVLEAEVWEKDSLARRFLVLKGILTLQSLAGPTAKIGLRSAEANITVGDAQR